MTIVLHLADTALTGLGGGHVGRIERGAKPISVEMIRDWCGRADTAVTVLPIVDDRDHIDVERDEIPDRVTDQADRRSLCCVFPWCNRSAVACDHDHVVPFGVGGMTCSCNIAPLCRRHHRLKTHTAWSYDVLEPGAYLWHSPFSRTYFRDNLGTADVTLPRAVRSEEHTSDLQSLLRILYAVFCLMKNMSYLSTQPPTAHFHTLL